MTTANLDNLRAQVEILRFVKARRVELKELEEHARVAVEAAMGDADTGTLDDKPAISWKSHKRKALDQKALKEQLTEIYEAYCTTNEIRRFEIVDE